MVNKEKAFNNQFKTTGRSGEHKNGRLAQMKNHNSEGSDLPNEYMTKKDET
ncbi:hypothetical protein ACFO4N_17615 [Camelliibacillus cellulosilyticus]|uniref:Uncharacterized protein n=1 Tax=Camelliibacillus cellulosilyticus TaxID=2174486 RepID=A0ABV9GRA3_9BACL